MIFWFLEQGQDTEVVSKRNLWTDVLDNIITGDLRFPENKYLRKLINKGPNFRKAITNSWDRCKDVKKKKTVEDRSQILPSSNKNAKDFI